MAERYFEYKSSVAERPRETRSEVLRSLIFRHMGSILSNPRLSPELGQFVPSVPQ